MQVKSKSQGKATAKPSVKKVEATIPQKEVNVKPSWEVKDRSYVLINQAPLSYHLKSSKLYYFDEEVGYEREILYSRNQKTVFKDEMQGQIVKAHVWFRDGFLFVPKNEVTLQKFLSLYHPYKDKIYTEVDKKAEAVVEVDNIELELEAMNAATSASIETLEAIMRVELGSSVSKMSSKELKRDALVFSRNNPSAFLDLMNDENIHLRNIGVKAVELGIIKISNDNRTFSWGTNGRKLMTVPFDEHPYSALAAWFKTDEGMEVLNSIEKKLK